MTLGTPEQARQFISDSGFPGDVYVDADYQTHGNDPSKISAAYANFDLLRIGTYEQWTDLMG